MYSITNVIVGIPLSIKLNTLVNWWEINEPSKWKEWKDYGFETFYHGGSPYTVGYCGVLIGEFDECSEWIRVHGSPLRLFDNKKVTRLVPTATQNKEAQKLVDALDLEIRELCVEFGVYLINSTS